MKKLQYIFLISLILWIPMVTTGVAYAQTKGKSLKELVAEEKARKEAEKQAQEAEKAKKAEEDAKREEARKAREERRKRVLEGDETGTTDSTGKTPEEVADFVTETDSSYWAPTQVKQLGAQNFGELTKPVSSLDLQDPNNITTTVEYQPETGTYIIRTKLGDTDITTPYLLTQEEYNHFAEKQIMHTYWQQKIGEVEHNNEKKFDITDMKFNIGPADKVFGPGGVQLKMQGSAELLFGFKHQYIATLRLPYARETIISSISTRRSKRASKVKWARS